MLWMINRTLVVFLSHGGQDNRASASPMLLIIIGHRYRSNEYWNETRAHTRPKATTTTTCSYQLYWIIVYCVCVFSSSKQTRIRVQCNMLLLFLVMLVEYGMQNMNENKWGKTQREQEEKKCILFLCAVVLWWHRCKVPQLPSKKFEMMLYIICWNFQTQ